MAKTKRNYSGKCSCCKQWKPITFRTYTSGTEVREVVDEKTGEKMVVEKPIYRRFPICFDCVKQPK